MNYSFPRYLAAKKPIDDRALNQHVWETMTRAVAPAAPGEPLRILEVGCGIGTMFARLSERRFPFPFTYTGIDASPENITAARASFPPITSHASLITPHFLLADLFALPPEILPASFDLLLAHAVLDLLDLPRALPHLFRYLRPGGVFYFTINFDGETIFQPEHPLDPLILALYHRTMDERDGGHGTSGSRTGRYLFGHLRHAGAEIRAAGSSDWVVFSGAAGIPRKGEPGVEDLGGRYPSDGYPLDGYPLDEGYFLHHILHFFEESLTGHPELSGEQLAAWLETRKEQIERHELVFIAHQLDFMGVV